MLHHRQQLDVREAHLLHVRHEPLGHLAIGVQLARPAIAASCRGALRRSTSACAASDRCPGRAAIQSASSPLVVVRCSRRSRRCAAASRSSARSGSAFSTRVAIGAEDLELVGRALRQARDEDLPVAGLLQHAHRMHAAVPAVEVADDVDAAGVGRPHREVHAAHAVVLDDARRPACRTPRSACPRRAGEGRSRVSIAAITSRPQANRVRPAF